VTTRCFLEPTLLVPLFVFNIMTSLTTQERNTQLPLGRPLRAPKRIRLPSIDSRLQPLSASFVLHQNLKRKHGETIVSHIPILDDTSMSGARARSESTESTFSVSSTSASLDHESCQSPKRMTMELSSDEKLFLDVARQLSRSPFESSLLISGAATVSPSEPTVPSSSSTIPDVRRRLSPNMFESRPLPPPPPVFVNHRR
jgi:hypothetical protein